MTIDETIKHCEAVASGHDRNCEIFTNDFELWQINKEWADNYYNIVGWLKELKTYRKGINEIKNKINNFKGCDMWDTANGMEYALELLEVENEETNS